METGSWSSLPPHRRRSGHLFGSKVLRRRGCRPTEGVCEGVLVHAARRTRGFVRGLWNLFLRCYCSVLPLLSTTQRPGSPIFFHRRRGIYSVRIKFRYSGGVLNPLCRHGVSESRVRTERANANVREQRLNANGSGCYHGWLMNIMFEFPHLQVWSVPLTGS